MKPVQLQPLFVERVWGTRALLPWFLTQESPIGEVWFTADHNPTSEGITLRELMERDGEKLIGTAVKPAFGGRFPILVKFLFTEEKLSVQVHPDDAYAESHEGSPGKTEMWYVLRTDLGAQIAAGFQETLAPEQVRQAVYEGRVEELLQWWTAAKGESYMIPAGTVHAVGGGLVICEIQQNSDITYRLWDYGRQRPLHVESALEVANLGPYPGPVMTDPFGGGDLLATCQYFETERHHVGHSCKWYSDSERFHLLVATSGSGRIITTEGTFPIHQGECWLIPACCGSYSLDGHHLEILRVYVPA